MSEPARAVFISGARGRIGSFLHAEFRKWGEVTPFSRTPDAEYLSIEELLNPERLANARSIIHGAWSTVPLISEEARGREWRMDIPFLVELLNQISHLPAERRPRLIFLSTASVYGPLEGVRCDEAKVPAPGGWYAFAKLAAENLIQEFVRRHAVQATILRISNVYGFPMGGVVPQGVIPRILRAAYGGKVLPVWGDGSAKKDYLHGDDFFCALRAVIESPATGTYNLSVGKSHSLKEVISMVGEATGREVEWTSGERPCWDSSQDYIANEAFCRTFGWETKTDLESGLLKMRDAFKTPQI